ncbi:hypothetical protein RHGRI_028609 [Rhododendron griersonianum]|uniref:Uncharacterized protein n=1 Tax=Rhododendron griersonianum TaxID=479676 RepID=A0AAV6IL25_9ERIC|nr:hypothetical protein RHGRI_028609 [Rhododendron griersonianum]
MMTSEIIRSIIVKNSCGVSSQIFFLVERSSFAIFTGAPNRIFLMFTMTGSGSSVASFLTLVIIVTSRREVTLSISPVIRKYGMNFMTGKDLCSLL